MIYPVLLCGGSGTRLWPLSRKDFPKQFNKIIGDLSLFQSTLLRFHAEGFAPPLIATCAEYRFIVEEQIAALGLPPASLLIEPIGRNTAPAILAAALHIEESDPEALLLVAPCDHHILENAPFRHCVLAARSAAVAGDLVTFGIAPTRPETGFGYLEGQNFSAGTPQPLTGFIEKPSAPEALRMLASGNYLWNAGIFLFKASSLREAFAAHAPEVSAPVLQAFMARKTEGLHSLLPLEEWKNVPEISIDYAVMEHASNLSVMKYDGYWSDLGGWEAVCTELAEQAPQPNVTNLGCHNSLLRSESPEVELVGIGLKDIIAIATPDAVLVAHRSETQAVKDAVAHLSAHGRSQAEHFSHQHRPWGSFERLGIGPRFQVKRLSVKPGEMLSLQSHHHRAEHWVVVEGTARVHISGQVQILFENQSIYVPIGAVHRLENPGKIPLTVIEVQTGSYLGEDDIERYHDLYHRTEASALSVSLQ